MSLYLSVMSKRVWVPFRGLHVAKKRIQDMSTSFHATGSFSWMAPEVEISAAWGWSLTRLPSGYVKIAIENGHL